MCLVLYRVPALCGEQALGEFAALWCTIAQRVFLRTLIPGAAGSTGHSVARGLRHCSLDLCHRISTHICLLASLKRTAVEKKKKDNLCLIYYFPTHFISRPHHHKHNTYSTRRNTERFFSSPLLAQGNQQYLLQTLEIFLLNLQGHFDFIVCETFL